MSWYTWLVFVVLYMIIGILVVRFRVWRPFLYALDRISRWATRGETSSENLTRQFANFAAYYGSEVEFEYLISIFWPVAISVALIAGALILVVFFLTPYWRATKKSAGAR